MSDRAWKKHERDVAALIGGKRYPANLGASVDCESDRFVTQCKLVQRMSLEEISALTEDVTAEGLTRHNEPKLGLLCIKVRRGKGKPSPVLVVMTSETFTRLTRYNPPADAREPATLKMGPTFIPTVVVKP